jgi:hypothetical protein
VIRKKSWVRAPYGIVTAALPKLMWRRVDDGSMAADLAALMVYIALLYAAETEEPDELIARQTYEDLRLATGISRKLVGEGLQRLQDLGLIVASGSSQRRTYTIVWDEDRKRFFKIPCAPFVSGRLILPFQDLTLRSKHELHALKLYLYLAAVRDNDLRYAVAAYEKIYFRTGISERYIRKAINVLNNAGMMQKLDAPPDFDGTTASTYGPNHYYFTGGEKLLGRTYSQPE